MYNILGHRMIYTPFPDCLVNISYIIGHSPIGQAQVVYGSLWVLSIHLRRFNSNPPGIGMLCGIRIQLRIRIDAQPATASARIATGMIYSAVLGRLHNFFNSKYSPLDLYDFAVYKGFREAFSGVP